MISKSEEFKFIKKILGDKCGHKDCFRWDDSDNEYVYVQICCHYSDAHLLADEYYLRGISFIEDQDGEYGCTGACHFSCMGLAFILSKETSDGPIRFVSSERHTEEEKEKMRKTTKPYNEKFCNGC